jgi:hypothetical protein
MALLYVRTRPRIVVFERPLPSGTIQPTEVPTPAVSFAAGGVPVIRASRSMTTAAVAGLLALSACGAAATIAPTSGETELGDAFGTSGTGGDGTTAPLEQVGDSSPEMVEPTMETVEPTIDGGCAVTVTGGYSTTIAQGSASSDHWLSDQEVADARLEALATQTSSATGNTLSDGADIAPVFSWLVISCGDSRGEGFSVLANAGATAGDVPFGPGTYAITPGFLSGSEDRTQFSAIVDVGDGARMFSLTSGTIEITKFDSSGVAGTVEMQLEQPLSGGTPKRAVLVGGFEFPCSGGARCQPA